MTYHTSVVNYGKLFSHQNKKQTFLTSNLSKKWVFFSKNGQNSQTMVIVFVSKKNSKYSK